MVEFSLTSGTDHKYLNNNSVVAILLRNDRRCIAYTTSMFYSVIADSRKRGERSPSRLLLAVLCRSRDQLSLGRTKLCVTSVRSARCLNLCVGTCYKIDAVKKRRLIWA